MIALSLFLLVMFPLVMFPLVVVLLLYADAEDTNEEI